MPVPDHSTIAEFRRRHETAIGELFVEVLGLCGEAGLVRVGEIAVDGTRMRANASRDRNRGYESIVTEILQEAERIDREEDERYGDARGDELPEQLRTREGRRAALKAARERLERERAAAQEAGEEVIAQGRVWTLIVIGSRPRWTVARVAAPRTARARGPARAEPVAGPALSPGAACWKRSGGWMRSSRSSTPRTGAYEHYRATGTAQ